jgi:enoyl-CoA hydratase
VQLRHFHEIEVWGALAALLACDVPILAVIDGACMGAGLELAACCDVRLASHRARFGAPIGKLGFPMAPREAALVTGALGASVARSMLLAAEIYAAEQLWGAGFLTRVVSDAALADAQIGLVQRICALGPIAARKNKIILRDIQPQHVAVDTYDFADTPEHREGIDAFLNKRPPVF